jgi:branched-chain amino acid transport system ATP-binding protein
MPVESPLLELTRVSRYFGGLKAVNDISFDVPSGVIKAVIGPNGAGKTTLFNCIAGSLAPTAGSISFQGEEITGSREHEIAYKGIVRTFQNLKLAGHMTALENVMVGRHTQSSAGFFAGALNLPKTWREEKEIRERACEYLALFGIEQLADTAVANLPFGKQRAVEFARAMAAEPILLLLDEPASGLNIYETEELAEIILKIKKRGITILLVEHDMSLVMDISDEIAVLNFGQLIASGAPEEVQRNPDVIEIYLGGADA